MESRHHLTYSLDLADGRVLRIRVSRPADTTTYGPSLWGHILNVQIEVTEDAFWDCVNHGRLPQRSPATPDVPAGALPASRVHQLIEAGMSENDVARMTLPQAIETMTTIWSRPGA